MHEHVHHGVAIATGGHLDLLARSTMLGVLGSAAHCVGMYAVRDAGGASLRNAGRLHVPWVAQVWYAAGRLTTYSALGALGGALGGALQMAGTLVGLQRAAAILAGGVLVITAVASLLSLSPAAGPSRWVSQMTAKLGRRMPGHPLALGLVLGLSAVRAAVLGSGGRDGDGQRTVRCCRSRALRTRHRAGSSVSLADALFIRRRVVLNRLSQVFVLVMGAWFLYRAALPTLSLH
ncbi:MAG: sulfite exporter TauE/SafE family protein [Vicinamibacterales bacterium]